MSDDYLNDITKIYCNKLNEISQKLSRRVLSRPKAALAAREHNIKCGLHSGIPMCCVKWFVDHWSVYYVSDEQRALYSDILDRSYVAMGGKRLLGCFGYVPCPTCAFKPEAMIELKACDCSKTIDQDMTKAFEEEIDKILAELDCPGNPGYCQLARGLWADKKDIRNTMLRWFT